MVFDRIGGLGLHGGLVTCYRLDSPVVIKFFAPVQTSPGTHPATEITRLFPGVKWPGRGINHPPQLAPRLNKE